VLRRFWDFAKESLERFQIRVLEHCILRTTRLPSLWRRLYRLHRFEFRVRPCDQSTHRLSPANRYYQIGAWIMGHPKRRQFRRGRIIIPIAKWLGLRTINIVRRALLHQLNNPQKKFRTIHKAGTKEKGSVGALIEAGPHLAGLAKQRPKGLIRIRIQATSGFINLNTEVNDSCSSSTSCSSSIYWASASRRDRYFRNYFVLSL
jgi:hypothetical protein